MYARTTQDLFVGDIDDFPADFRADMDSFSMGPKELVTNGEPDKYNWTTGDGSPSHTTSGNGRLNLNDAAAYQAISTTVNKQYRLQLRVLSPNSSDSSALIVRVGTPAGGGTQNLDTTAAVTDFRAGKITNKTFTATAQTSFIYVESDGVQLDVDYIRISRNDIANRRLSFISYDNYLQSYKPTDDTNNSGNYAAPLRVYILPNYTAFGVSFQDQI